MRHTSFGEMNCSVAQTLEVVGDWWTMLIVRDCFLGVTRFEAFSERLGIARNILAHRLAHLVEHDVLIRVAYQDRPVRYDYRLTEKGRDLWLVLNALRQWGDRWAAPDGPPVVLEHKACGHAAQVQPTCSECGTPLDARSLRLRSGPGAAHRPAPELRVPHRGKDA
jgi:DNA-binding HxlR family transcriptional regulator